MPSKVKMRSSKSRSRSKQNRPRSLGNIINRVFDSSGPEGKVRGTPQQVIEKYQLLARDAQLSNDRVAAENFLQHAEHYTRMLAEAQREMAAEQEARQQYHQQNGNGHRDRAERGDYRADPASEPQPSSEGFEVMGAEADTQLVDLPEAPRGQGQQPRREEGRRDDRGRDRNQRRDDRPRDDRPREDRVREDRVREDRPREDRVREDRPREDRRRAPEAQPELPAFITGTATEAPAAPETSAAPAVEPVAAPEPAAKPARAPRAKKPAAPKPEAPDAAE